MGRGWLIWLARVMPLQWFPWPIGRGVAPGLWPMFLWLFRFFRQHSGSLAAPDIRFWRRIWAKAANSYSTKATGYCNMDRTHSYDGTYQFMADARGGLSRSRDKRLRECSP